MIEVRTAVAWGRRGRGGKAARKVTYLDLDVGLRVYTHL